MEKITILGTGNAAVTRCFNTCFILHNNDTSLLVDAGGGNGILRQLELAGIPLNDISAMYITHCHTDHLLGAVWILRFIATAFVQGKRSGSFNFYGPQKVLDALDTICHLTLPGKVTSRIGNEIIMRPVSDDETFSIDDIGMTAFDIGSTKELQFGFRATLPSGTSLVCLGDEPFNERCRKYAVGADWLMHEAFCLYTQRDIFKPYEKHHSTSLEAGKVAQGLEVKNLILYHTEDRNLATRRATYTAEAATHFTGAIHVPDDLDTIPLS